MKLIYTIFFLFVFPFYASFAQMDAENTDEIVPSFSFSYETDVGLNAVLFGIDYHRYVSPYVGFGINPTFLMSDNYYASFVGPTILFLFTEADKLVKPFLNISGGVGFDAPKMGGKYDYSFATGTNASIGIKVDLTPNVLFNGSVVFSGIFSNDNNHPFKAFVMNTLSLSFLF